MEILRIGVSAGWGARDVARRTRAVYARDPGRAQYVARPPEMSKHAPVVKLHSGLAR